MSNPVISRSGILVAEDDPTDKFLLQWAFKRAGFTVHVAYVRDGVEVIDYLEGRPPFNRRDTSCLPALLMLDLKMPRMNGFEVLERLQHSPALRPGKVVVFSSSLQPEDIHRASLLAVDHYLVKPNGANELVSIVKRLEIYWSAEKTPAPMLVPPDTAGQPNPVAPLALCAAG